MSREKFINSKFNKKNIIREIKSLKKCACVLLNRAKLLNNRLVTVIKSKRLVRELVFFNEKLFKTIFL